MKQVPLTLVLAVLCVIAASWPALQTWALVGSAQHFAEHGLYLLAGGLFGLQSAIWTSRAQSPQALPEAGVMS